jgi:hypothetical protein
MFVVFQDYDKATGPKVHREECRYYQRWLKNPTTTTTTWSRPYESEQKAMDECRRIARRTGMSPSRASCCP